MRSTGTRSRRSCPANLVLATGGVVPPALQGHTPDIALRYDPDLARECLARSGYDGQLELAGMMVWDEILDAIAGGWRDVFGDRVSVSSWSWREEEALQTGERIQTAPIRITGWLPGYPGSGVLPPPPLPVDEPDERGRLRGSGLRRADRGRAAGAQRPRPPRALPRGGPLRRRRACRRDPARLRAEHGVRAAARARLVGVREELRELRRPRRRARGLR